MATPVTVIETSITDCSPSGVLVNDPAQLPGGNGGGGGAGGRGGTATGPIGGGITTGGPGRASGGVLAQPARATAAREPSKLRRVDNMRKSMWLLLLEAGVALFLLVFIVWWTMYSGPKPTDDELDRPAAPDSTRAPDEPHS
jgi:hypothetical protein